MKTKMFWMLALVMMVAAAPAFSGEVVHMFKCEMDDEADEEMIEAYAKVWLAAAKKLDGGANLEAYVYWPIAVNATGEMDLMFIVTHPSFSEFGKFWDAYPDSDAADIEEDAMEMVVCPDSVVWESVKVGAE